MSPKRDPVPRARTAWQWLWGFLLLGVFAAGVVAAGVKLWQDIDIQRLTRSGVLADPVTIPPALAAAPAASSTRSFGAVLYFSHASARHFPDSTYYPTLLDRWEGLMAAAGAVVSRASTAAQLEALDARSLAVVPAAVCLGTAEMDALRAHADRGGGLLLSWAAGARDSVCNWRGWEAVAALTGSSDVREVEHRSGLYLTVPSDVALSAGFDPGTRIELRYESQLAAHDEGARIYWSDWALNAAPVTGTQLVNAATFTRVTEGGGRIVWLGFRLGQGARPEDERRLEALAANGVRWAAGVPTIDIHPWPDGARAGLLIAQDVESEFSNAAALAALATRKSAPVTFFVVSGLALDYPELAESLRTAGEVGSQTSDHTVLSGLSLGDQRARLSRTWAEVRGWTGDSAFGLHPPEERFDANTLRAWRDVGGSYLVGINESRTGSPEVFETREGEIVLIPRIIKDDYNVYVQDGALRSLRLLEAYLEGLTKVRSLGGVAVVSLRSQVGGDPRRVTVIGELIDSARTTSDWWIATGRDIATWWSARHTTALRFLDTAADEIAFEIVAPSDLPLGGAWVRAIVPERSRDWIPHIGGQQVAYAQTTLGLRIALPDLAPGERITVTLGRAGRREGGQ